MKSDKGSDAALATRFWNWFFVASKKIAVAPEDAALINKLDQEVRRAWPKLAWEIGPTQSGEWYFALSPNLDRELVAKAKEAIDTAPKIVGWTLFSARQRKTWTGRFELETKAGIRTLESSNWRYILLRYPDGEQELVLIAADAEFLDKDERWQAAAIVIEGLLGEDCVLAHIGSFALEAALDAKFADQTKPIHLLPQAFGLI